jgi:hypothetical protein
MHPPPLQAVSDSRFGRDYEKLVHFLDSLDPNTMKYNKEAKMLVGALLLALMPCNSDLANRHQRAGLSGGTASIFYTLDPAAAARKCHVRDRRLLARLLLAIRQSLLPVRLAAIACEIFLQFMV